MGIREWRIDVFLVVERSCSLVFIDGESSVLLGEKLVEVDTFRRVVWYLNVRFIVEVKFFFKCGRYFLGIINYF